MEDLIQNAHTLFDDSERPSQSPLVLSPDVVPMSSYTYTSSLFASPQLPQFATVQAADSTPRPGLVGGIHTSPQSSFSSFPSDGSVNSRPTPPHNFLSPLLFGPSSSRTLTEGADDYARAPHTRGESHQSHQDFGN
jgi:hypothetical protein